MPGSALRLLNQGRAQGLFTPSTSAHRQSVYGSPNPYYQSSTFQGPSSTPPPTSLKRTRSDETDISQTSAPPQFSSFQSQPPLEAAADIQMSDGSRPPSTTPHLNGGDEPGPSPAKRQRRDPSQPQSQQITWQLPKPDSSNGISSPPADNKSPDLNVYPVRFASKPSLPRLIDPYAPLKDPRRAAIISAICQHDDPTLALSLLRDIPPDVPNPNPGEFDIDCVLDDQGHTALHLAASMSRLQTVDALVANGADIYRGNYLGETPLIRACLSTHAFDTQSFGTLVSSLNAIIRTLDTSRKSILHHITALAGLKGRAIAARYYLDQILYWIVNHQGGDFKSIVDLQDEHGDTALNIAARVGNRSLVKTLIDIGANRILPNKLGLRPGDFGVESEVGFVIVGLFLGLIYSKITGVEWWTTSGGFISFIEVGTTHPSAKVARRHCG
jgi:regulatory protein SWI6